MAEAHAAVAFQFTVTPEGFNVQISHEAIRSVYYSGIRSWRKRLVRFLNRFSSGVYPAKFSSLGIFTMIVLLASWFGYDLTYGLTNRIDNLLFSSEIPIEQLPKPADSDEQLSDHPPSADEDNLSQEVIEEIPPVPSTCCVSLIISCILLWLMVVLLIRYLLKVFLCYHGWMFEARGKASFLTKLWAICTKILGGTSPMLYSFQSSLPRLPVPALKDTVARYLRSVRPLLDDEEYENMKKLSEEFQHGIANRLQRYLMVKSWWASNYVSDWWEQYVYLAGRGPIMVNSNYYGMDLLYHIPTSRQASRAAGLCHAFFAFRSVLDKEKIKPIRANGVVPLCSAQYERLFNTCRIPGIELDVIQHWMDCRHVAVYHRGCWFKMVCYKNGRLLEPCELEISIESILADTSEPCEGEEHLAALTAGDRIPWARARQQFFATGVNRKSLHTIEKAAFVLVLDDEDQVLSDEDHVGLSAFGRSLLHGKCFNRWFDKTFNCIIYKNGRFGVNAEHSWADAPIISYLAEEALGFEYKSICYGADGKLQGTPEEQPIRPERLKWSMSEECCEVIETSLGVARNLADDVHLHVSAFKHFGKGLIKTFKVSPDAFIQSALQLAHLRDKGHFSLTYEASMTRLFREGRTETVRSCTNEMVAFARSMVDESSSNEERHALFLKAVDRHVNMYKEAMVGMGIDRHLFCLYVVSKYLKLDSPFLQKVLGEPWRLSTSQTAMDQAKSLPTSVSEKALLTPCGGGFGPVLCEPWRLSTSQTPHQQAMSIDLKKLPSFVSGGGGFGPVADDGYGVSYIICHENLIMFHVSSKYSSPETDSDRFAKNIERAMLDLKDLCESMKAKK